MTLLSDQDFLSSSAASMDVSSTYPSIERTEKWWYSESFTLCGTQ